MKPRVSIALAAVSGGMYEIGDDLPTLGSEPDRLALVQNQDLIDMARLGRSSTPLDLMSYLPEDRQPSIFLLKESSRQTMLTIFNWTEKARTHTVTLASLGLDANGSYTVTGEFDKQQRSTSATKPLVVVAATSFCSSAKNHRHRDSGAVRRSCMANHPSTAKGRRDDFIFCRGRRLQRSCAVVSMGIWRRSIPQGNSSHPRVYA